MFKFHSKNNYHDAEWFVVPCHNILSKTRPSFFFFLEPLTQQSDFDVYNSNHERLSSLCVPIVSPPPSCCTVQTKRYFWSVATVTKVLKNTDASCPPLFNEKQGKNNAPLRSTLGNANFEPQGFSLLHEGKKRLANGKRSNTCSRISQNYNFQAKKHCVCSGKS